MAPSFLFPDIDFGNSYFFIDLRVFFALRQVKGPHEKDCHLSTCHRVFRTVISASTAAGNCLYSKLLNPIPCPVTRWDIGE